jgi:hypothetical protein
MEAKLYRIKPDTKDYYFVYVEVNGHPFESIYVYTKKRIAELFGLTPKEINKLIKRPKL